MKIKRNDLSSVFEDAIKKLQNTFYISPEIKKLLDKLNTKK